MGRTIIVRSRWDSSKILYDGNVCVPINGPGKFRVKKCFVERELDLEATLKAGRPVDKVNA